MAFTEISLQRLNEIPPQLFNASKEGKLILVLGAGASKTIDERKPDWKNLTELLLDWYKFEWIFSNNYQQSKNVIPFGEYHYIFHKFEADILSKLIDCDNLLKSRDYQKILTILENINPSLFWEKLREIIYQIPTTEKLGLPHILAYLNPILIITTNWDRLLDSLKGYEIINWRDNFRDNDDENHLYLPFSNRIERGHPSILFLHGHISRLETVLITDNQYEKLYDIKKGEHDLKPKLKNFKDGFKYGPDLQNVISKSDVVLLFFGINPNNDEFEGIIKSLYGEQDGDIFILNSQSKEVIPKDLTQNIYILQYPQTKRELALDFLVKLPPRIEEESQLKQYQVFSSFQRKDYLISQRDLEKNALSIKYCTKIFTNVFGTDDYLKTISEDLSKGIWKEEKEIIGSSFISFEDFKKSIYEGMIARRDNLYSMINNKEIKRIDVLFQIDPSNIKDEEKERIKDAIELCKKSNVILQIKWINLIENSILQDNYPFKDPSMALIIGNSKSNFTVALCHASQATDNSDIRFQWIHIDTIFSRNRLGWFTKAWDLAIEYNI